MIYTISHTTRYMYRLSVPISHHAARLVPRTYELQTNLDGKIEISPRPAVITQKEDFFGNTVHFFTVQEAHQDLIVHARHRVDVLPNVTPKPETTPSWESVQNMFLRDVSEELLESFQFIFPSPCVPILEEALEYAMPSFPPNRPVLEAALDLTARIHKDFQFDPSATTISTPVQEVLSLRRGVCQDFAHLQIACLRALGLPIRYVSGYLLTVPPEGTEKLLGADASHAWVALYIPSFGWVEMDPTNNLIPDTQHIRLAWGRDYSDVSPLRGTVVGGGQQSLLVSVNVELEEPAQDKSKLKKTKPAEAARRTESSTSSSQQQSQSQ